MQVYEWAAREETVESLSNVAVKSVLRGVWDTPRLLFLGAPALDVPPLGLGHRATINGHHLPGLGLILERVEADSVRS